MPTVWVEDDQNHMVLYYAFGSVVGADLPVDAALFVQDSFLVAAEKFDAGYDAEYMGYLDDALAKSLAVSGHEEGPYRMEEKMDIITNQGTMRAGDAQFLLGQ